MVIPEDRTCRTDDHPDFVRDPRKASEMALVSHDTRQMARKDARELDVKLSTYNSASVKVINFNLFLKPY